jgi:very-short-patch-repair endonuclease
LEGQGVGSSSKSIYMSHKRKIIPYNPELKELARDLRKNMTLSEVLLWNQLKQKNIMGYDFDRQRPIENYIVDFYCKDLSLAIEIDGDTHIYRYEEDDIRQKTLENLGIRFLRFEDIEVKKNISNVLRVIEDCISKNQHIPDPSREGNLIKNILIQKNKPASDPSDEGNLIKNILIQKNQPTPDPSREGNLIKNILIQKNKPTSDPSDEGNLIKNILIQKNKPASDPSDEGN